MKVSKANQYLTWNEFRTYMTGSGLDITELSPLYQKYKAGLIKLKDLPFNEEYQYIDHLPKSYRRRSPKKSPVKYFRKSSRKLSNTLQNEQNLVNQPIKILTKIAMNMKYDDIIRLCKSNKNINKKLCDNDYFWAQKYKKDFGRKIPKYRSAKDYYKLRSTYNQDLVYILRKTINFNELSFELQKVSYRYLLRSLENLFKKYSAKVDQNFVNYMNNRNLRMLGQITPNVLEEEELVGVDYVIEYELVVRVIHQTMLKFNPVIKESYKYLEVGGISPNEFDDAPGEKLIMMEGLPAKAMIALSKIKGFNIKTLWFMRFQNDLRYQPNDYAVGHYNPIEIIERP